MTKTKLLSKIRIRYQFFISFKDYVENFLMKIPQLSLKCKLPAECKPTTYKILRFLSNLYIGVPEDLFIFVYNFFIKILL